MNPTIEIEQLSTGYRGKKRTKVVATNIDAQICSGELTCLLGSNGVGKSTLLKTICNFLPPLHGQIHIMGRLLGGYTDAALAKVISVVLTDKLMIRNMRVDELVSLGRSPYTGFWGVISNTDRAIVQHALQLVGIPHLAHRMIHTLSDGERQKALIAKALAQETPIILLDEPTAFLDYPSKVDMMQLLHRLSREENKTIFMSTHDLELALQIADKIWLLDKEKAVQVGTPEDLALQKILHRFVSRQGIQFDSPSGLFRVAYSYHHTIAVEGSGDAYHLLCKGLNRHGIATDSQKEMPTIPITVYCQEGRRPAFHVRTSKETIVHSIEEVLQLVEKHL